MIYQKTLHCSPPPVFDLPQAVTGAKPKEHQEEKTYRVHVFIFEG